MHCFLIVGSERNLLNSQGSLFSYESRKFLLRTTGTKTQSCIDKRKCLAFEGFFNISLARCSARKRDVIPSFCGFPLLLNLNFVCKGFHPLGNINKFQSFVCKPHSLFLLKEKGRKKFKSVAQTSSPACS